MKKEQTEKKILNLLSRLEDLKKDDHEKLARLLMSLVYDLSQVQFRKFGIPPDEIDEIVLSVIESIWSRLDRLRNVKNLIPYLYVVIRNKSYDLFRGRLRHQHVSLDAIETLAEEEVGEISSALIDKNSLGDITNSFLVSDFLKAITDKDEKEILSLYLDGNKVNEIAKQIDKSPSSVYRRLNSIKSNLRVFMGGEAGKEGANE